MPLTDGFSRELCAMEPQTPRTVTKVDVALVLKTNPYHDKSGLFTSKARAGAPVHHDPKDAMRIANLLKEGPKAHVRAQQMAKSITTWEKAHRRANAAQAAGQPEMAAIFRARADVLHQQQSYTKAVGDAVLSGKTYTEAHEIAMAKHGPSSAAAKPATTVTVAEAAHTAGGKPPSKGTGSAFEKYMQGMVKAVTTTSKPKEVGLSPEAMAKHLKGKATIADVMAMSPSLPMAPLKPKPMPKDQEEYLKNSPAQQAVEDAMAAGIAAQQAKPPQTYQEAQAAFHASIRSSPEKFSDAHMGTRPVSADSKDSMRIENLVKAAFNPATGVDKSKLEKSARTMAKSITDWKKAHRRANAAENENMHSVAAIFRERADEIAKAKLTKKSESLFTKFLRLMHG